MTDLHAALRHALTEGIAQVRFVAGQPVAVDRGSGRFAMTHGRAISEDMLAAFLLDHVSAFDVQDIFNASSLIGEALLGERRCRVVKRRMKGTLAVQVDLRGIPDASAGEDRITAVDAPSEQHAANRNVDAPDWATEDTHTSRRQPAAPPIAQQHSGAQQRSGAQQHPGAPQDSGPQHDPGPQYDSGGPQEAIGRPARLAPPAAPATTATPSLASAAPPAARRRPRVAPEDARIAPYLDAMLDAGASDLHLSSAHTPRIRVDGKLAPLAGAPLLTSTAIEAIVDEIAPDAHRAEFDAHGDADFAWESARARFRCNVFRDRRGVGVVVRAIPAEVPTVDDLGFSRTLRELCTLPSGLVLVTGPTGSGKSTTLAALVDHINRTRDCHVVTVEDPIEFVHESKRSLINQREVGTHTDGFPTALRAALREDPDVVLIGELRDLETTRIALKTAETGHLVFGTLHTNSATATVDRIVNQFPGDERDQVRLSLADALRAVLSQTLCRKEGGGRALAMEILLGNRALANLVREARTYQIPSLIQTARGDGMQLMNDALCELVGSEAVSADEALRHSGDRPALRDMLARAAGKPARRAIG